MPGPRLTITVLASITAAAIAVAVPAAAAAHRQQHPAAVNTALSGSAPPGTSHGCDPIGTAGCLIPFPDDYYAVRDAGSLTGERVAFTAAMMPASAAGVHLDPAAWDRSDGFSPGGPILTVLPGADLTASGVAPITDIGASLNRDAPIVLIDTRTGRRVPC